MCQVANSNLTVDVYNGAEKPPRSTLSVDVQHAQYLQEPHASVIATVKQLTIIDTAVIHAPRLRPLLFCSTRVESKSTSLKVKGQNNFAE